jgi:hypothetical protein
LTADANILTSLAAVIDIVGFPVFWSVVVHLHHFSVFPSTIKP